MDEEFTTTAYLNVQENLKLPTEDQESEVQSMVTVPIHQDTSSVPLMTTPVIDLTVSQPVSTTVQAPLPTSTAMVIAITTNNISSTTTNSTTTRLLRFDLDSAHRCCCLGNSSSTQGSLRDLLELDMKEILHQPHVGTNSYEAHEDHRKLYEALEKSMDRDHSEQLLTNLAKARRKKKRRHESPKTPPGSPPHQPLPPLPPAGPSRTSGASSASGSSQLPPPPPPPSTNQSDQSKVQLPQALQRQRL
ncbi:hypothetical protein Tco_0893976 [Tanacetum coccineum]|uniref:Uncharacterized protein n=1 Tax=Tanacetum coccineum TaxID=301880 RepID=A0ABQ5CGQ7_9ASTR